MSQSDERTNYSGTRSCIRANKGRGGCSLISSFKDVAATLSFENVLLIKYLTQIIYLCISSLFCVDNDECMMETHDCGENSVCFNVDGGFTCACAVGYENVTADGRTCEGT